MEFKGTKFLVQLIKAIINQFHFKRIIPFHFWFPSLKPPYFYPQKNLFVPTVIESGTCSQQLSQVLTIMGKSTTKQQHLLWAFDREIEKFIIRQPPMGETDDYDSENSRISDGLPSQIHTSPPYVCALPRTSLCHLYTASLYSAYKKS